MKALHLFAATAMHAANTDAGAAPAKPPGPTVLPKITVKDVKANPKACLAFDGEDKGKRNPLMRVYGVARGTRVKQVTSPSGEKAAYEGIIGDFRAVNLKDGSRFQSGVMYLPEGIHELISSPLNTAQKNNEQADVTFGMDIWSEQRDNAAGYGYGATILGEPAENEALRAIEAAMDKAGAPVLPAPAK